ncbi:CaiB/BaiF CoA-transferase family protein [Sphingopyxis macrogoltabida]|uniref:Acyl-CoA hydratase n=1 Tax=Sphingopyxis macrogoltabida TaxID=33050 RepID=A0AAC8YXG4_SPHMC|nr:CoA transferase [Sphingopyxis macrogoltabida]ALJ11840.1 putative acyl-CoA transferase/carnitine dehydratase [Sphingopyxis macrogoltabida]AMU88026.1 acyl-CoA hydratase [Sphingopyxis macrogoltabida]
MSNRPLSGVRIVESVRGPLAMIGRYLADLGAQVDSFASDADRGAETIVAQAGKRIHVEALTETSALIERAHIVIADRSAGIDLAALRRDRPALVTMSVSDFGENGPLANWRATGPVLHALSAVLSRSGIRGREPLIPPGDLAYQCAAPQAVFALLGALYRSLSGGAGAHFDFAALDGAVQGLDPGFGINGSATMGKPVGLLLRDRPRAGFQYPIMRCADGYVRICLLAKRQWRGMFRWMGEPEQFASPDFDRTSHRYASADLLPYIAGFFADKHRVDLEREGQEHGVPIASVLTLGEFLDSDHAAAREAVATLGDGTRLPNGFLTIDGARMGPLSAPEDVAFPAASEVPPLAPFGDLKVLDLGVIVVGAEGARLLGDFGADVIKIESQAFPDGSRQSYLEHGMSVSFAAGHRNKRSLGLDLRSEAGRALFLDLVKQADVVCSNFKPGTMEKLGLGEAELRAINPRIVVSESSAFGDTGPWSGRMGYGPLVRASTGLTLAWRYPDDPQSFSDSITVYPDHVAGRICAIGVAALLIRRLRTGLGGVAKVAQSEVMIGHFAADVVRGTPAGGAPTDWPWAAYRTAGDDEWCVITVESDADWARLCDTIGYVEGTAFDTAAKRLAARGAIDERIEAWLADRTPYEAAEMLQAAGIAAAPMLRLSELPDFPYYRERGFYRIEGHPWLQEDVFGDAYIARTSDLPAPPPRPAPLSGEQSAEVIADWLGVDPAGIDALKDNAVLEPLAELTRQQAEAHMASREPVTATGHPK